MATTVPICMGHGGGGGGGGGQCLLKQVSYACMDVFVQHAELFDAPA